MGSEVDQRTQDIGPGMRILKIAVVVMGVLIVAGTTALVVLIARGLSTPQRAASAQPAAGGSPQTAQPSSLGEPPGSRIVGITRVANGLALALQGGGEPDRVVVIDPASGRVLLRIGITR